MQRMMAASFDVATEMEVPLDEIDAVSGVNVKAVFPSILREFRMYSFGHTPTR